MATVTLTNLANYVWGIPADETAINIETFTAKATGQKKIVPNRQGLVVGRADFQFIKTYSIKGFISGSTGAIAAVIGTFITVANDIALGGVPAGQGVFLDDLQVDRMALDLSRISYNMSSYPGIASNATQTII